MNSSFKVQALLVAIILQLPFVWHNSLQAQSGITSFGKSIIGPTGSMIHALGQPAYRSTSSGSASLSAGLVNFGFPPCSDTPVHLIQDIVSSHAIVFHWEVSHNDRPACYHYEIRTLGLPGSGPLGLYANGTLAAPLGAFVLMGLQSSTSYQLYLRLISLGGDSCLWSDACSFTTTPDSGTDIPAISTENESKWGFRLQPNVVSNQLHLFYWMEAFQEMQLSVYDALGKEIYRKPIKSDLLRADLNIDVSSWPEGMYHLQLRHQTESLSSKFLLIQ